MAERQKGTAFWAKVKKTSTCWLWQGAPNNKGYGTYRKTMAHRFSWELVKGPIPEGMQLDHLCRTKLCVNPDHLELVTNDENARRASVSRGEEKTASQTGFSVGNPKKTRPGKNGNPLNDGRDVPGPGRPKGSRNWATILRDIGDATVPAEIQKKFAGFGMKIPTMREAAAIAAYIRSVRVDAVGNAAFEKIADREDGKPVQPLGGAPDDEGNIGTIRVTIVRNKWHEGS